ncbi:MAG: hypothetical protein ACE5PV_16740 [Candidatus Poribacteria bacterium]
MNIHDENFRQELIKWGATGAIPQIWIRNGHETALRHLTPDETEADARFQLAIVLLERGKRAEAITELKRASRLDPQNWIIRKQLWAIEHPEAFYEGDVDYGWQKEQQAREDAERVTEE